MEKGSKYRDLEREIIRIWSLKAETAPLIVGASSMIKNNTLRQVYEK